MIDSILLENVHEYGACWSKRGLDSVVGMEEDGNPITGWSGGYHRMGQVPGVVWKRDGTVANVSNPVDGHKSGGIRTSVVELGSRHARPTLVIAPASSLCTTPKL